MVNNEVQLRKVHFVNLIFKLFEVCWDPKDFKDDFHLVAPINDLSFLQINEIVSVIFQLQNILNLFSPLMHVLVAFLPNFKSD